MFWFCRKKQNKESIFFPTHLFGKGMALALKKPDPWKRISRQVQESWTAYGCFEVDFIRNIFFFLHLAAKKIILQIPISVYAWITSRNSFVFFAELSATPDLSHHANKCAKCYVSVKFREKKNVGDGDKFSRRQCSPPLQRAVSGPGEGSVPQQAPMCSRGKKDIICIKGRISRDYWSF